MPLSEVMLYLILVVSVVGAGIAIYILIQDIQNWRKNK